MKYFDREGAVQAATAAWGSSPDIRAEFRGNRDAFIAYRVAAAQGRTRLCEGVRSLEPTKKPDQADMSQPAHMRCMALWDASADLQKQFGGNFAAFLAHTRHTEGG